MATSSFAIETQNLTKTYKDKTGQVIRALNNLNLSIERGSSFGFVGPNGAGKTTAIKILIGLIFPSSGNALLFGKPFQNPQTRHSVGYLPEVAAYSPYFEAQELLMALASLHGMDVRLREKKSCALLELVGLAERRKSKLGEFSKGMLQRFGIAQALLSNPQLLILDEPTSGLDPIAQREVLNVLHKLKEKKITIFLSSHRLTEVEGLCDHLGIISFGSLIFFGTISQLEHEETQTPFLIRFTHKNAQSELKLPFPFKLLEGNTGEVTTTPQELDQTLHQLQTSGTRIVSVAPKRLPLEDIFLQIIAKHQGKNLSC